MLGISVALVATVTGDVIDLDAPGRSRHEAHTGATWHGLPLRSSVDNQDLADDFTEDYGRYSSAAASASARLYGSPPTRFIEVDTLPITLRDGLTPAELLNLIQDQNVANGSSDGLRRTGGIATDRPGHSYVCGEYDSVKDGVQTPIGTWCFFVRDHLMGRVDVVGVAGLKAASLLGAIDHEALDKI